MSEGGSGNLRATRVPNATNHFADRYDPGVAGIVAAVSVQLELGLLPVGRAGIDCGDCDYFDFDGSSSGLSLLRFEGSNGRAGFFGAPAFFVAATYGTVTVIVVACDGAPEPDAVMVTV